MGLSIPVIFLFYQDTWTASAEDAAETFLTTAMFNAPLIGRQHAQLAVSKYFRRLQ
jgi:hypothetical protein